MSNASRCLCPLLSLFAAISLLDCAPARADAPTAAEAPAVMAAPVTADSSAPTFTPFRTAPVAEAPAAVVAPAAARTAAESAAGNDNDPDACWRHRSIGLSQHPIGFALHDRKLRLLDSMVPTHPIGFVAQSYSHYPGVSYGFGGGLEASFQVVSARVFGRKADPVFYGLGLQKQLIGDPCQPRSISVSIGGYGYVGNSYSGGSGYVVASSQVAGGTAQTDNALYAHLGVEVETYSNTKSQTNARPFIGASVVVLRGHLTINAEAATKEPWERAAPFAIKAAVPVYKGYAISFGIVSNGFRTGFAGPF